MRAPAWVVRLRPDLSVVLPLLLINLFVFLLAGLGMRADAVYLRKVSLVTAENLSSVLAGTIAGEIDRLDIGLAAIVDEVERQGERQDLGGLLDTLGRLHRHLPELEGLRITDAAGRVVVATGFPAQQPVFSVADRAYFTALRDGARHGLYVSKPLIGRTDSKWVVIFARRISANDGSFSGVAYGAMGVDRLNAMLTGLQLGTDGAVALRDADLAVVARYPETVNGAPAVSQAAISQELRRMVAESPEGGAYQARAGIDGIERILSYRRVGAYPMTVVVGLSVQAYRERWWRDSLRLGGLVGAFTLMTVLGAVWLAVERRSRRRAYARLQESRAELARFAEVLAHHLQEPVRLQYTYAQRLERVLDISRNPDADAALSHIRAGALRLRALLRDARLFLSVDHEAVEGQAEADGAVDAALERLGEKLERVRPSIERKPLPAVRVAEGPLTEVFAALLDNALEYRHPDRPCHIVLAGRRQGGEVVLSVTDNGIGIAPAQRERVFEVFERLQPQQSREKTGIGLALVRKVVLAAEGRLWIEDGESGGIRVCLSLPVAPSRPAAPASLFRPSVAMPVNTAGGAADRP